jgi:hypothetical protein
MTPNDSEMDVLLRRFAKVASGVRTTDHLDADELSAFAEGSLPPPARSHYVSHLADCDDCRRAVTELAAASGRVEPMTAPLSQPAATESWWQKVGRFFAPARLRYAAFAAVLVAVVGIGFAVWRNSPKRPAELIAQSGPTAGEETRTVSQPQEPAASKAVGEQSPAAAKGVTQAQAPFLDQKQPESTAVSPSPPPKPANTLARNETAPSSAATGRGAEISTNAAPSYAPPPPVETERADTRARERQSLGILQGPQRGEPEKYKTQDDRLREQVTMRKHAMRIVLVPGATNQSQRKRTKMKLARGNDLSRERPLWRTDCPQANVRKNRNPTRLHLRKKQIFARSAGESSSGREMPGRHEVKVVNVDQISRPWL